MVSGRSNRSRSISRSAFGNRKNWLHCISDKLSKLKSLGLRNAAAAASSSYILYYQEVKKFLVGITSYNILKERDVSVQEMIHNQIPT